jgi:ATP/ADP translocase
MSVVALPFYLSLLFSKYFKSPNALLIPVYIGLLQNVLSKVTWHTPTQHTIDTSLTHIAPQASKYALFDPTKEMAYIPLDKEAKVTGKAAIDVLCARLGKSMGAFIQQLLVVGFGSITRATPLISVLFYAVISLWIGTLALPRPHLSLTNSTGAVNSLAPMFQLKNMM